MIDWIKSWFKPSLDQKEVHRAVAEALDLACCTGTFIVKVQNGVVAKQDVEELLSLE